MALDKEKANGNELTLPTPAEQSEVCLVHQCSKSYLLAMLQDPPENNHPFSKPQSTSHKFEQVITRPLQFESVLMGLSGDGKRLLLLPSSLKPQAQGASTPPPQQGAGTPPPQQGASTLPPQQATTSMQATNENVSRKRPLDSKNPGETNKTRKSDEGDPGTKRERETELGPRCNCKLSVISKKFHCNDFTDEDRMTLFTDFWKNNNSQQRKDLVCSLVKCGIPNARRRECTDPSRKEFAFQYNLKKNGEMLRVCKIMFLTTLSVGDGTVRDWVMCGMSQKPFVNL